MLIGTRGEGSVIPNDRLSEANRLLLLAEALSGFGHWRANLAEGTITISPQMSDVCGLERGARLTTSFFIDRVHPDDRDRLSAVLTETRETGQLDDFRLRWMRPDGPTIHMTVSCRMDGPDAMFGIVHDSTGEVERERALIVARDQARAAERARGDFLTVMSEEIRTPMQGVIGTIDLLREDPPEQQRLRLFESLAQSACTLMTVVDDLVDQSRIEVGRIVLESREFDLKVLVRNTADLYQGSATAKGLSLEANGIDGDPAIVRGDPARVQQILSNLLSNAIKFTDQGKISITASISRRTSESDYWMVMVQDSGIGIGEDALGRIFSRFEQVDAARNRLQGGAGLGLSISQQLAEAMGGSIAVSSEPGQGSIFSVELPFATHVGAPTAAEEGDAEAQPLRILLAEDNPINRRLMKALLIRHGHDVVAVEDGRKALSAMTTQRFDLVLMDMQMPELDGLGATRAIRALDPPASETTIVAISADAMPERRRLYFEAGVDSFLPKPIVSRQLIEMIDKMRRSASPVKAAPADHFNRERLSWLVEEAGEQDAATLIRMLLFDVTDRPKRIAAAVRARAWEVAATEAESLRALLDNFGQFGLSQLLGSIARQCARHALPPALIEELETQAASLAIFFRSELGGLPGPLERAVDNVVEPTFPVIPQPQIKQR
ncbi:PAS domain-containing hybrid sensor histidine kinase/response regulator [Sphingomonas montanisoli]|uniref:PAS domain-containing hybrid sensor histidine kinase/response regulator n=1 Tax=Sphingomonas montanisoli TaxID=2606412 RepID=UPI001FE95E2C|nr:PAS domain-containing hybrid sensor histidine kinase/response regulator [Sphingomonas montanisoli]